MSKVNPKEYALYKGDKLLAIGTCREIAIEMGIKESTVYFYSMPSNKKRASKRVNNRRTLILLEDEEDEF